MINSKNKSCATTRQGWISNSMQAHFGTVTRKINHLKRHAGLCWKLSFKPGNPTKYRQIIIGIKMQETKIIESKYEQENLSGLAQVCNHYP